LARTISSSQPITSGVPKMLHTVVLIVLILCLVLMLWSIWRRQ
jgi:hypothetical protein